MKYDICLIAESMFWWFPVVLDLDTGKTYTLYNDLAAAEVKRLRAPRMIPHYSEASVYQKYLAIARDTGIIDTGDLFERYPTFGLSPLPEPKPVGAHYCDSDEVEAFYKEADILCSAIPADSGLLALADFLEEYEIELAKEWCEQTGLEWYDKRPESSRHTLPEGTVHLYPAAVELGTGALQQ